MKIYYLALVVSFLFVTCSVKKDEPVMCTEEFRTVSVKFKDSSGNNILVENYKAVIKSSGLQLHSDSDKQENNYIVATDADNEKLSKVGDTILVTANHPVTKALISENYVIKGGVCHIEKVSGPDELSF